jgi:hypothetical protein
MAEPFPNSTLRFSTLLPSMAKGTVDIRPFLSVILQRRLPADTPVYESLMRIQQALDTIYQQLKTITPEAVQVTLSLKDVSTLPAAGWSAATGTASRATFVTSTVTTADLAQRLKALEDDLLAKGILGP